MTSFPWHRREHNEMLEYSRKLTLEEYAVLNGFIDFFCVRGGDVPDDDEFLRAVWTIDIRVWRRLKRRLIDLELIECRHGRLYSPIAERVFHDGLRRIQNSARAGRASAEAKRDRAQLARSSDAASTNPTDTYPSISLHKVNKNRDIRGAAVLPPFQALTSTFIKEERRGDVAQSIGEQLRTSPNLTIRAAARIRSNGA